MDQYCDDTKSRDKQKYCSQSIEELENLGWEREAQFSWHKYISNAWRNFTWQKVFEKNWPHRAKARQTKLNKKAASEPEDVEDPDDENIFQQMD